MTQFGKQMNLKCVWVLALVVVLAAIVAGLGFWKINPSAFNGVGADDQPGVPRTVMPFSGVQYAFDPKTKNVTNIQPLGWTNMQWMPSTQTFSMQDVANVYQGNIASYQHVVPDTTFLGGPVNAAAPYQSLCHPGEIVTGFATYGVGNNNAAQGLQVLCKSIWNVEDPNTPSTLGTLDNTLAKILSGTPVRHETPSSWVSFLNPGLFSTSSGVLSADISPKPASVQNDVGAAAFLLGRDAYRPVVNDPTCTSVFLQTDGTRVNPEDLCIMNSNAFKSANAACAIQAKKICNKLSKDDPYCACINAQPIPDAAKAMGLQPEQLPPRCLSNGDCMSARFQDTWMSYLGASSNCCPTLTLDLCKVLLEMDPSTIVRVTNSHLNCTGAIPNTCDRCTAGGGPCVYTGIGVDGETVCKPKQADGTCPPQFEECTPNSGGGGSSGANNSVIGIIVGVVVGFLFLLIFVAVLANRKR